MSPCDGHETPIPTIRIYYVCQLAALMIFPACAVPVAAASRKLKKRAQRATDSSQQNGVTKGRSSRAKRKANEAGIPDVASSDGAKNKAKQQRANLPEAQGQPADQLMEDAAEPFTADDDDFEPLPPPQVRMA